MADNYLEKQRAEYEARKAAWEKACKLGIKKPIAPAVKKTDKEIVQKDATQEDK